MIKVELTIDELVFLLRASSEMTEERAKDLLREATSPKSDMDYISPTTNLAYNPELARRNKINLIRLIREWICINERDCLGNSLSAAKKFVERTFNCP